MRVHNLILWQSHRTGYWICEVYDRDGFKAIGLGPTKDLATQRASSVAKIQIPVSRIPQPVSPMAIPRSVPVKGASVPVTPTR